MLYVIAGPLAFYCRYACGDDAVPQSQSYTAVRGLFSNTDYPISIESWASINKYNIWLRNLKHMIMDPISNLR